MKSHTPRPLVLCEGTEDRLVMEALASHAGIAGKLVFEDYGGQTKLKPFLKTLEVRPEFARGEYARVLVTRDADQDFDAAWASISGSIQAVFKCAVTQPGEWGACANGVPISAWVVPGPGKAGMIETLCLDAARSRSPEMFQCLDPFVECLGKLHAGAPHEKVRFALWTIIAQGQGAKDRLSLDRALANLHLEWDSEAFSSLKAVLRSLIN